MGTGRLGLRERRGVGGFVRVRISDLEGRGSNRVVLEVLIEKVLMG